MSAHADRQQTEALAELYAHRPAEFTAARKQAVAAARARKPELARWLAAQRRPSPVLWAVNALAREADVELGRFLDLGRTVQAAQRKALAGDARALRDVGSRQRELLNRLVARASAILEREGSPATRAGERRIRSTLSAAVLGGAEVRDQLRAGALATELDAADVDLTGMLASSVAAAAAARPAVTTPPPKASPARHRPAAAARDDERAPRRQQETRREQQAAQRKHQQAHRKQEATQRKAEQARARAADKLERRAATLDASAGKLAAQLERLRAEAETVRRQARALRGEPAG